MTCSARHSLMSVILLSGSKSLTNGCRCRLNSKSNFEENLLLCLLEFVFVYVFVFVFVNLILYMLAGLQVS